MAKCYLIVKSSSSVSSANRFASLTTSKTLDLGDTPFTIGRGEDVSFKIDDQKISRHHCRIEPVPDGSYKLIDLGSSNGTFVNGTRVTEKILQPDDVIRVGNYEIGFVRADKTAVVSTPERAREVLGTKNIPVIEEPVRKEAVHLDSLPTVALSGRPPSRPDGTVGRSLQAPIPETKKPAAVKPEPVPVAAHFPRNKVITWRGIVGVTLAALILVVATVIFKPSPQDKSDNPDRSGPKVSQTDKGGGKKAPPVINDTDQRPPPEETTRQLKEAEARRKAESEKQRLAEAQRIEEDNQRQQKELEEEQRRVESERRRQEEETRRQTEEAQKQRAKEQEKFNSFKPAYDKFIKTYQFSRATKLCQDDLKELKAETFRAGISLYADEAERQFKLFDRMIKRLSDTSSGRTLLDLDAFDVWINKADETGFEGPIEKEPDSLIVKKWTELPAIIIYNLLEPDKLDRDGQLSGAIFCYDHNLIPQGDHLLIVYASRLPEKKDYIDQLLCRKKGIELPPGGFVVYQGQFVTPEEKSYLEKGWVKHEGKWMPYDDMMAAKGFIKWEGHWVTKAESEQLQAAKDRLEAIRKLFTPKGVIDKPGCDKEQLPWEQARTKESDHYKVKTNLSEDALNDIAYVMECLYFNHKKFFKAVKDAPRKLDVLVFKNGQEYKSHQGMGCGVFMGDKLMTYYIVGTTFNTTGVLLHEGTHHFISLVCPAAPIWANEGFATYMECAKFDGKELKTNLVNRGRLPGIQGQMRAGKQTPMKDFINFSQQQYMARGVASYEETWSIIYFLINGKNGRYARGFEEYFNELKTKGTGGNQAHIQMFERIFKTSMEVLEEEWKDYILNLK